MRLVLDWDGTVTEVDTLHMVLLEFGDPEVYLRTERSLGRKLTLHEVIALEFETVRAPLADVQAFLVEHARVREGFAELARRFRPLVVSAGFHELIEPVLAREGVEVELYANRLEPGPTAGVRCSATRRPAPSAASPASAPRCRPGRSCTPATATRTGARRSPPGGSSQWTASPPTSTARAFRTSR